MPNSIRKKLQLYRNDTIYTPTDGMSALDSAKAGLSSMTLEDGEIVIGRYKETNDDVKTVIGVVHDISNDEGITFFVSSDDLSNMYVRKPDVLYETDGTTGLLGLNQSELGYSWQLQGYDFTPYKYLRCYFKMADFSLANAALTPSMVIELPLDTASLSKSADDSTQEDPKTPCDMYIAGGVVSNPSDPTSVFTVLVAVDSTKTKFQVVNEISYDEFQYDDNYSNTVTNRNNNGRYLYKIEGCYDALNSASTSEFVEHDPVFTASPAYGITSTDIDNWNSMVSGGSITGIKMNGQTVGTSGIVDLGTVLTSHQDISGKADRSAAIGSLSLVLDSTNYKITLSGTKVDGTSFTVSNVIDLPLESVVVSGSYNDTTKKVVLTLQNGSTIDFSVADLVAGLQSEITSANKLSADLISDGTANKVVTSTEKNTWNNAASNSHTHSNKTVLDGITSTDITNWNNKTDNVGTVTGVKMNNTTNNPTDGVVDLGTVITSETQLSKGATTGGGNAVTDITVNNHQITLTKGSTFLTSHQSIKMINGNSLVGTGNVEIIAVPSFTSADNGKILGVVNGQLAWVTPTTIYTGSGVPSSSQGNDGDIYLQTN